jgi:hypothetical protein
MAGLPDGWKERLYGLADLEASFWELDGIEGFAAEAQRGRIRSLQVRIEEADDHFSRAEVLLAHSEASMANLVEALRRRLYERDHSVLKGEVPKTLAVTPHLRGADDALVKILRLHRAADAAECLLIGGPRRARRIYRRLLRERHPPAIEENRAAWHMGLAACHHNLGSRRRALRHLETAGLFVAAIPRTLGRVACAGTLVAIYRAINREAEAAEWIHFVERVECPEETKACVQLRGRILAERSRLLGRLVVV